MAEPESHTLHLLREIREDIRNVDRKVDMLDRKVERNFADLQAVTDELMQTVSGELAIRGYIVNGVEERLAAIERRLSAIEESATHQGR